MMMPPSPPQKKLFFFLFHSSRQALMESLKKFTADPKTTAYAEYLLYVTHFLRVISRKKLFPADLNGYFDKHGPTLGTLIQFLSSPPLLQWGFLFNDQYGFPLEICDSRELADLPLYRQDLKVSLGKSEEEMLKILRKVDKPLPVLNSFSILDNFGIYPEESWFSELFELFFSAETKSKTGTYYTPPGICEYLTLQAVVPQIFPEVTDIGRIITMADLDAYIADFLPSTTKATRKNRVQISKVYESIRNLTILDPAVGSGNFIVAGLNLLVHIIGSLWEKIHEWQAAECLWMDLNGNSSPPHSRMDF